MEKDKNKDLMQAIRFRNDVAKFAEPIINECLEVYGEPMPQKMRDAIIYRLIKAAKSGKLTEAYKIQIEG